MPTVPDYNGPQVQPQALPGIRVQSDVPLSALGGGQAAAELTQSQLNLGKSIEQEITKQKREADQMMVLGVESEMAPIETDLVHGPNGALSKRGLAAMDQPEATADAYKKIAQEKISKLPSADARMMASQRLKDNQARVYSTVMTHAAKETENLYDTTTSNYIENETNAAIKSGDMTRIADAHDNILTAIGNYSKRKGLTDIEKKTVEDGSLSKLHAGVVTSLLNKDNFPAAKRYYDATFKAILPADERNLTAAMKEGDVRYKVQGLSDQYFSKYPDKGEAQPEIDKIKDPEVRKALNQDLDYRYGQKKQQLTAAQQNVYLDGMAKVVANPGSLASQSVDPTTWANMTPGQRKSCEDAINPPVDPNGKVWLEFTGLGAQGMAQTDKATFTEKYWSKMNPAQRIKAEAYWTNARDAAASPEKAIKSKADQSFENMIDSTLQSTNLIPYGKTRQEISKDPTMDKLHTDFSNEASREVELFVAQHGREATDDEMRKIMGGIAVKKFYTEGTLYGTNEMPFFQAAPADFAKVSVKKIDEQRPGSVSRMTNYLTSKGQSATKENIGQLYYEMSRNPNLERLILE